MSLLISSAAQLRELDRRAIELGIPGVALMESASRAVAELVRRKFSKQARLGVVVVCGSGNNGGDGYGAARWLASWGFPVRTWSLAPRSSGDAHIFRSAATAVQIPEGIGIGDAGVVIDAIFGTGLSRAVDPVMAEIIQEINDFRGPVVSVDIPSGVEANTGRMLGAAVRATATVSFGRYKPCFFLEPGLELSGEVELADIGIESAAFEDDHLARLYQPELWPIRKPSDHKNRSGHLLIIAGSENMLGAAILTSRGALAAGVGLLTVAVPKCVLPRCGGFPPEVMVIPWEEQLPLEALTHKSAIAAGPGLGQLPKGLQQQLSELWQQSTLPLVFDADALPFTSVIVGDLPRVLTPHPGEAARLLDCSVATVQIDRFQAVSQLSSRGVALLKGRYTLIADQKEQTVNPTNSPVLATGGSGDVLTGVIGALLARQVEAGVAARLGAWVHGRAGEWLESRRSNGWSASDIAAAIPEVIAELLSNRSQAMPNSRRLAD